MSKKLQICEAKLSASEVLPAEKESASRMSVSIPVNARESCASYPQGFSSARERIRAKTEDMTLSVAVLYGMTQPGVEVFALLLPGVVLQGGKL